jgi:DNA repair ATPase RecN
MSENLPPEESLSDELQNLGKNLVEIMRTAWDHPERKRFQEEIVSGLNTLGNTMKQEAESLANSSPGQQFKSNMEQIGERLRSAEVQDKVRQEMLSALQNANNELQKVIDRWSPAGGSPSGEEAQPKPPEDTGNAG